MTRFYQTTERDGVQSTERNEWDHQITEKDVDRTIERNGDRDRGIRLPRGTGIRLPRYGEGVYELSKCKRRENLWWASTPPLVCSIPWSSDYESDSIRKTYSPKSSLVDNWPISGFRYPGRTGYRGKMECVFRPVLISRPERSTPKWTWESTRLRSRKSTRPVLLRPPVPHRTEFLYSVCVPETLGSEERHTMTDISRQGKFSSLWPLCKMKYNVLVIVPVSSIPRILYCPKEVLTRTYKGKG